MIGRDDDISAGIRTFQQFINHLADFLADMIESAGSYCQHTVYKLTAAHIGDSGMFARFLRFVVIRIANVIAGITNLNGSIIKFALDFPGGICTAGIKIIFAAALPHSKFLREAVGDMVFPFVGGLLSIVGHSISLIQRIFCCQQNDRQLTPGEKQALLSVFQQSLSLYNIRIVSGWSGVLGLATARAFTLGNLIFTNKMDFIREPSILVHECVHVWQYQHKGVRYAAEALFYQLRYRKSGTAYNWTAEPDRGRTDWSSFNPEAAAALIEDIWRGRLTQQATKQQPFSDIYADQFNALRGLRGLKSVRPSAKNNPGQFSPTGIYFP